MMSWICPECGRECSAVEPDCPICGGRGERSEVADPALPTAIDEAFVLLCEEILEDSYGSGELALNRIEILARNIAPDNPTPEPGPFGRAEALVIPALAVPVRGSELLNLPINIDTLEDTPVRKESPNHWIATFAIATMIFLAIASIVHRLTGGAEASAGGRTPGVIVSAASIAPEQESGREHPLARFVEVTGLRIVPESNEHSLAEYLVVNHSGAHLTDLGLRIDVRSAAGGDAVTPLFRISVRVPDLGPHESKELRTSLEGRFAPAQLPDWENLRTRIRVISEQ